MQHFMCMYDLVQYVYTENHKIFNSPEGQNLDKLPDGLKLVPTEQCLEYYEEKHGVSRQVAVEVLVAAMHNEYLSRHDFGMADINTLSVMPNKGLHFLQKIGRCRIGMWNDIIDHYTPISATASVIISISALIVSIVAAYFTYKSTILPHQ